MKALRKHKHALKGTNKYPFQPQTYDLCLLSLISALIHVSQLRPLSHWTCLIQQIKAAHCAVSASKKTIKKMSRVTRDVTAQWAGDSFRRGRGAIKEAL